MFRSTLTILTLFFFCTVSAQKLDHRQGQLIIQFHPKVENVQSIIKRWDTFQGRNTSIKPQKCLSESMNTWLLKFDYTTTHDRRFLQLLRMDKAVLNAQFNHFITFRNTPNDPDFMQQWQYINDGSNGGNIEADLDADLAWDITTGGITANGDTIVIAALDDGVDLNHEDFGNNLWKNHDEIPDNGIDDDNNGYIDDVFGWNAGENTGNLSGGSHGTPVMGIMGAKGNNGIGVTGVSWDVKIMMVKTDFLVDEATLITGYGYPLALRKLYNDTDGAEGAFVVATNASWGIDNGMPEDAPIWCALYDSLGTVGILNCGATANENVNVDIDGDLPTTCPSDYIIGVTNVNRAGEKDFFAGFGKENIDLGAFGEDTYTLAQGNRYDAFGGTSGATPHVTGTIGLLYAAPCNNFANLAKNNPAEAALLVRQYILEGVKPNELLDTLTATGGQLNMHNSLQLLMQACGPCPPPLAISAKNIIDITAEINWISSSEETTASLRYRPTATNDWIEITDVKSPYQLTGLTACTNYEYQLKSDCGEESSGYTRSFTLKTDGCCIFPENIQVAENSGEFIRITWDTLFAAERYEINFGLVGMNEQNIFSTTNNFFIFETVDPCETYEFQVRTICRNETTAFSPLQTVTTVGCGSCTDAEYCVSSGDEDFEWISRVILNTLDNTSGSEMGYGDYTSFSTDLNTSESYELTVEISFQSFPFAENVQAWIDFNQDGVFQDSLENIVNLEEDISENLTTTITIPPDAKPGLTRMRIGIKWREGNDPEKATPCSEYDFGEVEDYCVNIIASEIFCQSANEFAILDDPVDDLAVLSWQSNFNDISYTYRYRIMGTEDWQIGTTDNPSAVFIRNLEQCRTYEIQVQTVCDSMTMSEFGDSFSFESACGSAVPHLPTDISALKIFPNPTSAYLEVDLTITKATQLRLKLYDLAGNELLSKNLGTILPGKNNPKLAVDNLISGVYLLNILTDEGNTVKRVIKI